MSTELVSHRRGAALAASLVLLAALGLAACAGTLDDPDAHRSALEGGAAAPAKPACADVVTTVFASSCATAGCHAATSPAADLDLATAGIFERYAGRAAKNGTRPLLDRNGDANESVLYLKLQPAPPYGGVMPPGAALDETKRACVAQWITDQAARLR